MKFLFKSGYENAKFHDKLFHFVWYPQSNESLFKSGYENAKFQHFMMHKV